MTNKWNNFVNVALLATSLLLSWVIVNYYYYSILYVDPKSRVTRHFEEWQVKPDIVPNLTPQANARKKVHKSYLNALPEDISFPLGGVPDSRVIYCIEDEGHHIEKSDRYGFFNPDVNWDSKIDILIVGDSFAQGACTNFNSRYHLQNLTGQNTITLGMGGNGSLIEFASLIEFLKVKKAKHILWYIVSNDITDLDAEREAPTLLRYLDEEDFNQSYFSRDLSDYKKNALHLTPQYLELNKGNIQFNYRTINKRYFAWDILSGHYVIQRISNYIKFTKWKSQRRPFVRRSVTDNPNFELMKLIFIKANKLAKENDSTLQFVFIPSKTHCYQGTQPNQFLDLQEFFAETSVPYLDAFTIAEENSCDSIYATNGGHLNSTGYKELAKFLKKHI